MGPRGLGLGLVAALLLAGALTWWGREAAPAASPAARDGRPGPRVETELDPPAAEVPAGSSPSAAAPGKRAAAGPDAPELRPVEVFRGQVVDVVTRTPVFGAQVVAGGAQVDTDREGRFDLGIALGPEVELARVMNPCQGTHIRDARRETWELQEDGGWVLPIVVGPTFRLRLEAGPLEQDGEWRARVVEVSPQGAEQAWGWARLCPGDPCWFRYDNPQASTYPGPHLRLEVQSESGLLRGSAAVSHQIAGLHPQVPSVHAVERLALVRGVVVDRAGAPQEGIEVLAARRDPPARVADSTGGARARTSGSGDFELAGLTPGVYDLRVHDARGAQVRLEGVSLPPGETTLAHIVLERATPVGSIRGELVGEGEIHAQLHLRALDGRPFSAFDSVQPPFHGYGRLRLEKRDSPSTFQFNDLPAGEYELEVLPLDGRAWSPRKLRVSPPAEGLVFTREEDTAEAFFRVVDATTGRELEEFLLQLHPAHLFTPGAQRRRCDEPIPLAVGQPLRWVVSAAGHVPAHGDEGDFHDEGGSRVATVALSSGWGATLVLRDQGRVLDGEGPQPWTRYLRPGERPPVPGVIVRADGVQLGTSDTRGVVHLRADREPERIELVAPGWRVLESARFGGGRLRSNAPEVVVWLVRR